jgi:Protein kinase domain
MKLDTKPGRVEYGPSPQTPLREGEGSSLGTCEVSKPLEESGRAEETPVSARRRRHALESVAASSVSAPSDSGSEKFILLDQLHQEFYRQRANGEPLDPDVYCAQFPAMKSRLKKLLQAELFLEEHAELFDDDREIRWPEAGKSFLDFHLKLELGRGAFARVFLATEPRLGNRLVAVKIAKHGAGEAEILGRLKHPNIVPVHSVQEDETTGLTAVCMPYVGGATLDDVLDKAFPSACLAPVVARSPDTVVAQPPDSVVARFPDGSTSALVGGLAPALARVILDAVRDLPHPLDAAHRSAPEPMLQKGTYIDGIRLIGAQLAEALTYIHEGGICHRDLKPSNVLMSPEGVPMLLDFNLCADANATLNLLGGTIAYMSPEQLRATEEERRARPWLLAPCPSSLAPRARRAFRYLFLGRDSVSACDRDTSVRADAAEALQRRAEPVFARAPATRTDRGSPPQSERRCRVQPVDPALSRL